MADYTKSNELMTRISLKYDSYTNWLTNDPVLLAGEVAIATIPANTDVPTRDGRKMQDLPNVVMKVGDGTSKYSALKFVSALAADVYDWAKAADKPSYGASEIVGLKEFVEDISDIDTNTQYTIVPVAGAEYKFELKKKEIGEADFSSFATPVYMDMSGADTRLKKLEADLAAIQGTDGFLAQAQAYTNSAIEALDATLSQAAGADGLALNLTQVNGVVTGISGSIAANTYDAYGEAAKAESAAKKHADDKIAQEVIDRNAAIKEEEDARKAAIKALTYSGVEGTQAGATIKFVDKISQANGIVSAELGELVFNSAYDAANNKAATMSDVTAAVADLNGAMHFEGVYESLPSVNKDGEAFVAGDVIIVGATEYVYSNGAFVELGDEGAIAAALSALTLSETGDAAKTLKISQANGKVSATAVDIAIAKSQVTGLETDLENLGKEDARLAGLIKANEDAIKAINGNDAGKAMRTVAAEEAAAAVNTLDKEFAAQEGKYISGVKQENGLISATYADLPVIPELKIEHASAATTPEANEVVVVGEISNNGHTITDTHVKVATTAGIASSIAALKTDKTADAKHVVTGIHQTNGVISSIDTVAMSDIAYSGDVKDLKQTANTYVVFNCGSSSVNV